MKDPENAPARRRIIWVHVLTVLSAAILIGAEVFGAAFAGGWALGRWLDGWFGWGDWGVLALRILFFVIGLLVMASFIRAARRVEPFTG